MCDKHQIIEERNEGKLSRSVLKTSGTGDGLAEFNTLATLSTGVVFQNPKHYKTNLEKLRRLSKSHSRKSKGSNNRKKSKIKLRSHHAKVANLRKNTLHQITTYLCKNHAKIVVEDLNVSGMLSNHKLAQVIADCGFFEFQRQLEYKAKKFGGEIIIADRWYPSSKTCSNCGHIQDMPLEERTYNCESCNFTLDRDLNAAINLRQRVAGVPPRVPTAAALFAQRLRSARGRAR
jgi:putative transposase